MVELLWSALYPDERRIRKGATVVKYDFPERRRPPRNHPRGGQARREHAPRRWSSTASCSPSGEREDQRPRNRRRDRRLAAARRPGAPSIRFIMAQTPSFRSPHASFQEIEELLLVKGVTPDLFYGSYVPAETVDGADPPGPRLVPRGGLMDCLSVYGSRDRVDANTAAPGGAGRGRIEPVRDQGAGDAPRPVAAHREASSASSWPAVGAPPTACASKAIPS